MISTLEITVQRAVGEVWPVVAEYHRAGQLLPVRSEEVLKLAEPGSSLPDKYGQELGKALFAGKIQNAYVAARGGPVRIWLCVEDPMLRTWRWEWLHGPVDTDRWDFLSLDQHARYSLYLPSSSVNSYPPIGRRDLRALVVVANPADPRGRYSLAAFDSAAHVARLRHTLDGHMPYDVLARADGAVGPPSLEAIVKRLTAGAASGFYSVLHIVCHGWVDPKDSETWLYFEQPAADESGLFAPEPVEAAKLIEELRRIGQLPHLVFLSVCQSSAPEAEQRLGGLAQRLVRELGIPAVIGMTEPVTVVTAQALSEAFYSRLLNQGKSGAADQALVEAYVGLAQRLDVHVPALYSRLGPLPLFSEANDRPLDSSEIRSGLDRLDSLLSERAPILLRPQFAAARSTLEPFLALGPSDTPALSVQQARDTSLSTINQICQEVLDLSFNELVTGKQPSDYDSRQPFRGLSPFRPEDREFFFGREALVETLARKLDEDLFLPVLGPSGSGKSSVVLAGLVPLLQKRNSQLQVAYFTPGVAPLEQLQVKQASLKDGPVLYIVDQFEEIFTLCTNENKRRDFIETLLELSRNSLIVLTMRADFWGECARYTDLKTRMQARQEMISSMTTSELRSAMDQQAAEVKLRFEADLSYTILDEVAGEPGAMPLLQHALLELWKRRHGRWLLSTEYRAVGGVKRAIAETADRLYEEFKLAERDRMRGIFLRLTQLDEQGSTGEERRDTRRRLPFMDLVPAQSDPEETKGIVKRLADAVLVITSHNPVTNQDEVEVAHEALIRYWDRLRGWLDEDREGQRLRKNIGDAATEWNKAPTDETLLVHQGNRLDAALSLRDKGRFPLTDLEIRYIIACDNLRKKQIKRSRNLVAAGVSIGILLVVLGTYAWLQQNRAKAEAQAHEASRLIRLSNSTHEKHNLREVSALLAIEAFRQKPSVEADEALRRSLATLPRKVPLGTANEGFKALALSGDGKTIAAVAGNTIKLWKEGQSYDDVFEPWVHSIALDTSGQYLAVASGPIISVINIKQWPSRERVGLTFDKPVKDIAFSPDGQLLAGTDGATVRIWHTASGSMLPDVIELSEYSESIGISDDGIVLIAYPSKIERRDGSSIVKDYVHKASDQDFYKFIASPDGRWAVRVIDKEPASVLLVVDAEDGTVLDTLQDPGGFLSADFSVDGRLLITTTPNYPRGDTTLKIWEVGSRDPIGGLTVDEGTVYTLVGGGPAAVSFLAEKTGGILNLWDASKKEALLTVKVDPSIFAPAMALNKNGSMLAVAANGGLSLWDVISEAPLLTCKFDVEEFPNMVALSPTGERVALTTEQSLKIFEVKDSGNPKNSCEPKEFPILAKGPVVYSTDGKFLAVETESSIEMLDSNLSPQPPLRANVVFGFSVSPQGTLIVGDTHNGLTVWDLKKEKSEILIPANPGRALSMVAFSEDGKFLVSGSQYEDTLVWQVNDGFKEIARIKDNRDPSGVEGVSITSDGQFVAKANAKSIAVWDVQKRIQIADIPIGNHGGSALGNAVFSADGKVATRYSAETGIQVIRLLSSDLIDQVCKLVSRNMDIDEWKLYMVDQKRERTCKNLL